MILAAHAAPTGASVAKRHPDRPVVIAHRGASKAAPENTLVAYREAIAQGATIAETDVHLSRDGVVVVLHDKTLDRTTDGAGAIAEVDASALLSLDAGGWFDQGFAGERVPTLDALVRSTQDRMALCIEIKAAPERGGERIAGAIAEVLDGTDARSRAIIFSFYPRQVVAAKAAMPDVPVLFLIRPVEGDVPYPTGLLTMARSLGADLIGIDHRSTTPQFVAQAQAEGFPVFVYTVDAPRRVEAMVAAGVDGIITNLPADTQRIVDQLRPAKR